MERLLLRHKFAVGDTLLLAGLCRDIARTYPGRFDIVVDTHYREIFERNPYARAATGADLKRRPQKQAIISYQAGITAAGRGQKVHMFSWYHRAFTQQTGIPLAPTRPSGDIVLDPGEREPLINGRYWLLVAGGKIDVTVKIWRPELWQSVVDQLSAAGISLVQAGARFHDHIHPQLRGVVDVVNQFRSARQFANLVANADGVICPITAAMHLAAIFDKPCVVIAGGREEPWWEHYTNQYQAFGPNCPPVAVEHRFLHTLGQLNCCKTKGCWKHRTALLGNRDRWDKPDKLCHMPISRPGGAAPQCLELITPDRVVEAVLSYPVAAKQVQELNAGEFVDINTDAPAPAATSATVKVLPTVVKRAPTVVRLVGLADGLPDAPGAAPTPKAPQALPAPQNAPAAPPARLESPKPPPVKNLALAHPVLGGKLTAFVLCYGPHPDLARRCLGSILDSVPAGVLDLRVAAAACCPETLEYLATLPITKLYRDDSNPGKYVLMRRMFRDPDCPITTKYLLWFDDDTRIAHPGWLAQLCDTIVANHATGGRMYGNLMIHDLQVYRRNGHNPHLWFQRAPWWRRRNLRVRGTHQEAPNGTVIQFAVGWFWAMATELIAAADIPDARLKHNGGDITIGEQVHQAGFKLKQFNPHKALVWCPSREAGGRRGKSESFLWARP